MVVLLLIRGLVGERLRVRRRGEASKGRVSNSEAAIATGGEEQPLRRRPVHLATSLLL